MMNSQIFALVLAGGTGECFWPISRKSKPKQLLNIFSDTTLLEDTLTRLEGFIPQANILILTNHEQEPAVRKLLPNFPAKNILAEPAKRNTAAAIALGAAWVALRNHSATMVVLPADHLIKDKAEFQNTLQTAIAAARESGDMVAIGIEPSWPCTEFGYIELGTKAVHVKGGTAPIHNVVRFREKPNAELAENFIRQGNFRWNAGMLVWQLPTILSAFERYAPEFAFFIERIHETKDLKAAMQTQFAKLPQTSIDYAVMEKASRVLAVEASFDWDDVGDWNAISKYLPQQVGGNVCNGPLTVLNANNNVAFSDSKKHVAFIGVNDLIVVETRDAIFVCRRDQVEKIKQLMAHIPEELQ